MVELVVLSFLASLGFGIVFQMEKCDLFIAGLGGAITRIAYLFFMSFISNRIIYAAASAFVAAIYAESMAKYRRSRSTMFLYPAIIPLIPGDLFYYTMYAMVQNDRPNFEYYISESMLALVGISIGFVLVSSILIYVRKMRNEIKMQK